MKSIIKIDKDTVQIDKQIYKKVLKKISRKTVRSNPPTLVYIKWEYEAEYLGQIIKTARMRQHLSQNDIAFKIGVSKQYISLVECNKQVSYNIVLTILKELDLIIGIQ